MLEFRILVEFDNRSSGSAEDLASSLLMPVSDLQPVIAELLENQDIRIVKRTPLESGGEEIAYGLTRRGRTKVRTQK